MNAREFGAPSALVAGVLFASAAALAPASCGGAGTSSPATSRAGRGRFVASNLTRADYAGSASCEPCHAELFARWSASPMHNMTRLADAKGTAIDAPFGVGAGAGAALELAGDAVAVEQREGRRYMRVTSRAGGSKLYRVTKVIGGRVREDFAGVEVADASADAAVVDDGKGERVLPLSWLKFERAWRYKGYSVQVRARDKLEAGVSWQQTCIFCHNTPPRLATLYSWLDPAAGKYQATTTESLLPASRTVKYAITDPAGLSAELAREVEILGARATAAAGDDAAAHLRGAVSATWSRFDESHLVEVGIGCEACHNGSREHVESRGTKKPSFALESPWIRATLPGDRATEAALVNRTCARCHAVLFSRYPHTWEGGSRGRSPGGSTINSGEGRDFLLGGCSGAMACSTCHDPHGGSDPKKLAALATPAGNGACTSCHAKYAPDEALRAHAHHDPAREGGSCVACHMPKKNAGLAYELTRYHRIGSPTDAARVERDRPIECALCHADVPVGELVSKMESWWGKRFEPAALRELYGDPRALPLEATLERGKPHERLAAAASLAEQGRRSALPAIAPVLVDEYPLVRRFAKHAMEKLAGRPMPVDLDLDADEAAIRRAAEAWLER